MIIVFNDNLLKKFKYYLFFVRIECKLIKDYLKIFFEKIIFCGVEFIGVG